MPKMLLLIKTLHSLIWVFFVSVILYINYCSVTGRITVFTWIAISFVILEGAVLLIFKNQCPLTIIARKYSNSTRDNFDIFLPNWLAKYNKLIFTTIFLLGFLMVLFRCI